MTGGGLPKALPQALLCDLDGVLRVYDDAATRTLEQSYGLPAGTVDAVAYAPELFTPAVTGAVTDTEWRLSVAAALVDQLGSIERAASFVSDWSGPAGVVDERVLELLHEVRRRGVRVVVVSNATTRLETDLSVLGLRTAVDEVVSSARLNVAMPDEAFYQAAVQAADVPAAACLYVDDTEAHVVAARAHGMSGHHYTGVDGLAEALGPTLVLPAAGGSNGAESGHPGGSTDAGGDSRVV